MPYRNANHHNRVMAIKLMDKGWTIHHIAKAYPDIWELTNRHVLRQKGNDHGKWMIKVKKPKVKIPRSPAPKLIKSRRKTTPTTRKRQPNRIPKNWGITNEQAQYWYKVGKKDLKQGNMEGARNVHKWLKDNNAGQYPRLLHTQIQKESKEAKRSIKKKLRR